MEKEREGSGKLIRFDWAMKRLLRDKANFSVLEGFLTSLLGENIIIDDLIESEANTDYDRGKLNRVDILAKDKTGRKMIIEVQNQSEDEFFHRILFGMSKLVNDYLQRGENYDQISRIYSISLIYFKIANIKDYIFHGIKEFRGLHTGEVPKLADRLKKKYKAGTISDLYPEYYILFAGDFDKWSKTPIDQWMYFLPKGVVHEDSDAPGLDADREKMRVDLLPREEKEAYFRHFDDVNSMRNVLENAKEEVHCEGHKEGVAEGLGKGLGEGIEKGRVEERLVMARQLLANGLAKDMIMSETHISES